MEAIKGTDIKDLEVIKDETTPIVEEALIERPVSFSNARLEDETFEAYKLRRTQIRKYLRQRKFYKSHGTENRAARRKRTPLRLTSPLKQVRGKWMVGHTDVSYAIKHRIPLHYFLRVAKMGLDVNRLTEMGNQISEEIREEANGNLPDTVTE